MIKNYITKPHAVRRMRSSYLGWVFDDYISYLDKHGYKKDTIQMYCQAVEHFGQYCSRKKTSKENINKKCITAFMRYHLPNCQCKTTKTHTIPTIRAALHRLLNVISINNTFVGLVDPEKNCIDEYINIYNNYLINVCGIAKNTIIYRKRYAHAFLKHIKLQALSDIEKTSTHQMLEFIKLYASRYKSSSVGVVTGSVKQFLNFIAFKGYDVKILMASIPKLPNWKLSSIPSYLDDDQLKRFLASFDVTTSSGKRDYAMARCFIDLGLRCCEVANIKLCDLNWYDGILKIAKGKRHQVDHLPLTHSLGEAIADYLFHGRPKTDDGTLYVYHRAPFGKGVNVETVRGAMRRAYQRAGFNTIPSTHILRRTFATKLLHAGTPLKEIADILRHRSFETTMTYTKVDLPQLQRVVMPWFGRKS